MKKSSKYIATLDIGTQNIYLLIAEINSEKDDIKIIVDNKINIDEQRSDESYIENLSGQIRKCARVLEQDEEIANANIELFLTIPNKHISIANSYGIVEIKSGTIQKTDIEKGLELAQNVSLTQDEYILDIIPYAYIIDDTDQSISKNPVGMNANKLEIKTTIVKGKQNQIKTIVEAADKANFKIKKESANCISVGKGIISDEDSNMGNLIIDIGKSRTNITILNENNILYISSLAIGGDFITEEIQNALKIPYHEAEEIKIKHGICTTNINKNETFTAICKNKEETIEKEGLCHMINFIILDLFDTIKKELTRKNVDELYSNVILCGGVSETYNIENVASDIFNNKDIKIGYPININNLKVELRSPSYANVIGSLLWWSKKRTQGENSILNYKIKKPIHKNDESFSLQKTTKKLVNWFKESYL